MQRLPGQEKVTTEMSQEQRLPFQRPWQAELINHNTLSLEPGQASESLHNSASGSPPHQLELAWRYTLFLRDVAGMLSLQLGISYTEGSSYWYPLLLCPWMGAREYSGL